MDQQQLRAIEYRCIQEEQPFCTASCPLHVDVRGFMACLAKGNIRGARRILDRTMPFPDIVGRLCDQPCYPFCKRGELGDPLCTGHLERYCVSNSNTVLKLPKLPLKTGSVAIFGGGLSGMTAALDLARKGRPITLFTQGTGLGGTISSYAESLLPNKYLTEAEALLAGYGVSLQVGASSTKEKIASLIEEFDAVYFDLDEIGPDLLPGGVDLPEPQTLALGQGHFAGGGIAPGTDNFSVIKQVEDGRRAGLSIERFLQKVSLTAQREMEGTQKTRMYTSTEGIVPEGEIVPADPAAGYTDDEARLEAARCIHCECLECVKQCVYLRQFKEYPKTLVRKIYNNQSIVQGTRAANKMIDSCSLCTQCTMICPNDFPVAEVCRTSRQYMVDKGHMPPSAHEFALEDMRFSLSEFCTLSRHQPGTSASRYLFYPGCQLAGSNPQAVKNVYKLLCDQLTGGVGLMLGCCGIPARWAGQQALFSETIEHFKAELDKLGRPRVITACTSCLSIFEECCSGMELVSLWEVLDGLDLSAAAGAAAVLPKNTLAVHDPCTVRHREDLRNTVRGICTRLGLDIVEHQYNGELTDCCGYGGLMQFANPPLGSKAAQVKAERSEHPGLVYCAMCRDNLVAEGRPAAHLLDYIFFDSKAGDPLQRSNPGFSGRHENRARLREQLLTGLWGETVGAGPEHKKIVVVINQEVSDLLNSRHILEEDIQKVIQHAEQTGKHLINPHNSHRLASFKPVRVTYWLEYEPIGRGYVIHNGYSHRMQLPEERA